MAQIKTVYLISHTHTDIGYTDHQPTVFRQHLDFIDQAIELGEATADYPVESRYKWTCEVTSFVERYFRERPAKQIDRFLALHKRGQMAGSHGISLDALALYRRHDPVAVPRCTSTARLWT